MKFLLNSGCLLAVFLNVGGCNGQSNAPRPDLAAVQTGKHVGGYCEGCDLMYAGMPESIPAVDTSAGWFEPGQKLLVRGTIYQRDGKTPAPGVILYYYHTDNEGYYSPGKGLPAKAERHGHIRGWVKTDENGRYAIYTIRPAAYPNTSNPQHIHPVIREPGIANEYYIDEWLFDDDPLLTDRIRRQQEKRGGSGIVKVSMAGDLQIAERDIILGLNVPDYPEK